MMMCYTRAQGPKCSPVLLDSALVKLSFSNKHMNSQLDTVDLMPLLLAIIKNSFNIASVYVLLCLKDPFNRP